MLHAKKSLGQNFLHNRHVIAKIASLLSPSAATRILEIGPGHGALTAALQNLPHAGLLLLEKDHALAFERARAADAHTRCVLTDALTFPWERVQGDWIVCGNLPYNIASPLIWEICSRSRVRQAVFMVQKEVGQRLTADPSTKAYGALSVWVQSFWQTTLAFLVGPGNFTPPPKIESAVVVCLPHGDPPTETQQVRLKRFLDLCFQNRRKQLGGILKRHGFRNVEAFFAEEGLSLQARPEELGVRTLQRCADFFCSEPDDTAG